MATPRYDPRGHPLLSPAACKLDPTTLGDYAVAAERVLGLRSGPLFTGGLADEATTASVLQINLQVRLNAGTDGSAGDVVSEAKGDQSFTYATDRDGRRIAIDSMAQAIADRLLGVPTRAESVNLVFTW